MRSSSAAEGNNNNNDDDDKNNKENNRGFSSSSKSTSSSNSSSSSPSPSSLNPTPRRKTMEEVWKDISLYPSSREELEELSGNNNSSSSNSLRGMILQDFLARPFNRDPPSSMVSSTTRGGNNLFGSPVPSHPAIGLCLNSVPEFHYLEDDNIDPLGPQLPPALSYPISFANSSLSALASSSSGSGFPSFPKKRVPETNNVSGDRRYKRMIKNRESAARSRARKQAYTTELEHAVDHLVEENARLRRQAQQVDLATSAQLPKKHNLHRTSTAPF